MNTHSFSLEFILPPGKKFRDVSELMYGLGFDDALVSASSRKKDTIVFLDIDRETEDTFQECIDKAIETLGKAQIKATRVG